MSSEDHPKGSRLSWTGSHPTLHGVDLTGFRPGAGIEVAQEVEFVRTGGDAIALLGPALDGLTREHLVVAYLDAEMRLLRVSGRTPGDCTSVELPLRAIVRDALECAASGLILAHNHPSGDPTPSAADLTATRVLADTVRGLSIRLIDHIVIAASGYTSLRAMGLL